MASNEFAMWIFRESKAVLRKTWFLPRRGVPPICAFYGCDFDWTKGPMALVLFFLAFRIFLHERPGEEFIYEGSLPDQKRAGCIQRTLAWLLPKKPKVDWVHKMFGIKTQDDVRVLDFIKQPNKEGKNRDLPFHFNLAPASFHPHIYLGSKFGDLANWPEVIHLGTLVDLYEDIEKQFARRCPGYQVEGVEAFLGKPCAKNLADSSIPLAIDSPTILPCSAETRGEALRSRRPALEDFVDDLIFGASIVRPKWRLLNSQHGEEFKLIDPEKLKSAADNLNAIAYSLDEKGMWFDSYRCWKTAGVFYQSLQASGLALESNLRALGETRALGIGGLARDGLLAVISGFHEPHERHYLRFKSAVFLSLLGAILADFGRFQEGLLICQQAERIFCECLKQKYFQYSSSECQIQRGYNLVRIGHMVATDKDKARQKLTEAMESFQELFVERGVGIAHFSIVRLFAHHGEDGRALDYFLEHQNEISKCSKWGQTNGLCARGYLLDKLGNRSEARPYLEVALEEMRNYCIASQSEEWLPEWRFYRPDLILGPEDNFVKALGPVKERDCFPFTLDEVKSFVGNIEILI